MTRKVIIALIVLSVPAFRAFNQDLPGNKLSASGYVSLTGSAMHLNFPENDWYWEGLLHNRLNFFYYPSDRLSLSLQLRNRFLYSDRLKNDLFDIYRNSVSDDAGLVDLSLTPLSKKSLLLNSAIDRLWIQYSGDKFEITAGRQRINWGLTYVWNANDWFNNFSFFDIDYIERPGSDALRLKYYTGAVSSIEAVAKTDSSMKMTVAGLFRTNIKRFDLQFLGGILGGEDAALGFGWAGGIGDIGFRGEMSYFHPLENTSDTTGVYLVSVALDYTFSNSLTIQAEALYNQQQGNPSNFAEFYSRPLSVKDLSFTEFNFFMQASYPVTPLLNGSVAVIYFPDVKGYFLGPSVTYSLGNNLELAVIMQYFSGEFPYFAGLTAKQELTLIFGRIKWNF